MPELPDNQLDGLFRKSAEEFEPPFDPAAWQDMNARLNARDRTAVTGNTALLKKLLRWGLPLLLLLLFVGGWYDVNRANSVVVATESAIVVNTEPERVRAPGKVGSYVTRSTEAKRENMKSESANLEMNGRQKQNMPSHFSESEAVPVKNIPELKLATDEVNKTEKPAERAAIRVDETNRPEKNPEIQRTTLFSNPGNIQKRTRREWGIPSILADNTANQSAENLNKKGVGRTDAPIRQFRKKTANRALKNGLERGGLVNIGPSLISQPVSAQQQPYLPENLNSENSSTVLDPDADVAVVLPMLTELSSRAAIWPRPAPLTEHPVTLPAEEKTARRVVSQPAETRRGLSVRFVVAPDLSAVGLKNFSRTGTNLGLLLEYRLASRWSVQAGVMQSTKVYRASTSDYDLPDYVKRWPVQPKGIDGTCIMFDIPINIRYDIVLQPRQNGQAPNRWFISGGVTTYIMKQEDYTYQYDDPTNPHIYPANRQWSGSTGKYGFSQLNLSAGYEQSISRRLSWQVEPFIKVPLKKVGYFKIDLLSTGAFFSLRYKL